MPIVSDAPMRDWLMQKMYPNYRSMNQQAVGQGDAREKRVDTMDTLKYQELLKQKPDEATDPEGYKAWLAKKDTYANTSLEDFDAAGGVHAAVANSSRIDAKGAINDALSQKDLNRDGDHGYKVRREHEDAMASILSNIKQMPYQPGGLDPNDKTTTTTDPSSTTTTNPPAADGGLLGTDNTKYTGGPHIGATDPNNKFFNGLANIDPSSMAHQPMDQLGFDLANLKPTSTTSPGLLGPTTSPGDPLDSALGVSQGQNALNALGQGQYNLNSRSTNGQKTIVKKARGKK